jgi:uncharacterized protein
VARSSRPGTKSKESSDATGTRHSRLVPGRQPGSRRGPALLRSLFDWSYRADPGSGAEYQLVTYPGQQVPSGGFDRVEAAEMAYAAFCVQVAAVGQTCDRAVELGGKVLQPTATTPSGLVSAHLLDADGNRFVVFTPPSR